MTAINGTPRLTHPPRNPARTNVRRTSRVRPSRRRALAVAITAALVAGTGVAIDAATTSATDTTPPTPGTSVTRLPNPLLGPTGLAPDLSTRGPSS
jgi:hypothetical protein